MVDRQAAVHGTEVLDHVQRGWKVIQGATAHPPGYRWINNNKSLFGGEYKHALVPEEVAREWQFNNISEEDEDGGHDLQAAGD